MPEELRGPWPARLIGLCAFLGAFLLFQVQPLMGGWILPWFGGGAAVWIACLLFFQSALFAGYVYAHVLERFLPPWPRAIVHLALLAAALALLPILPREQWKPDDPAAPIGRIVLLLAASVGAPYLLLSSTAPLVQSWHGRLYPDRSPYRLYALSNAGSLLALLSYPFLFEPWLGRRTLSLIWTSAFALFAVLFAAITLRAVRIPRVPSAEPEELPPVPLRIRALWILLPAFASAMLLASTNRMCEDVIVLPFFWVLPLAAYLLSFILTFDRPSSYPPRFTALATALAAFAAAAFHRTGTNDSLYSLLQIASLLASTLAVSMLCHGEVARLKPAPRRLTSYYLSLSAGGALGGAVVNLVAPRLFASFLEWKLGIGIAYAAAWALFLRHDRGRLASRRAILSVLLLLALCGLGFLARFLANERRPLESARNFYGVVAIEESPRKQSKEMINGRILHGRQYFAPEKRRKPTTYFGETSGVGRTLKLFQGRDDLRVGVVGLGVGTIAAYGKTPSQSIRFYEINPEVERLARKHFTFLSDCPSRVEVIPGDARLSLEREPPQGYHVLVLDAFSGVTIPSHLLTVEAMQLYLRHLDGEGVLAMHVSNPYLDLAPVVRGLARRFGLRLARMSHSPEDEDVPESSTWLLLTRHEPTYRALRTFAEPDPDTREVLWTDDLHALVRALTWD